MSHYAQYYYDIALTLVPTIGNITAKKLVQQTGNAKDLFTLSGNELKNIPGINERAISALKTFNNFGRVEEELKYIESNTIELLSFPYSNYPNQLKSCADAPYLMYYYGEKKFEKHKTVAIVGTRRSTEYGKIITEKMVEELASHQVQIISGLALGIDTIAHKAAIKNQLSTIGVLAHGLDTLYPAGNKNLVNTMLANGGILTEYMSGTIPETQNFPERNRIVAGLCDAIIIVESGVKGGALITAEIANSYNKDVFAVPGKITDTFSVGCNNLIKQNKAHLFTSVNDLVYIMGWDTEELTKKKKAIQKQLFVELNEDEQKIMSLFSEQRSSLHIDLITSEISLPQSKIASVLLNLEFSGIIKSLPGKMYLAT
jgi:DNA processing protein